MAEKEEAELFKSLLVPVAISTGVVVVFAVLVRSFALERRVYAQDSRYLVNVRYPGQRQNLQDFVQPDNPDVLAVYHQYGPDPWSLYNFVCQHVQYVADFGEWWRFPSETLRGYGDCEDTSILLTSLIRAGGVPNCYVALGSLGGYGHAWVELSGQVMETTYTSARPVMNVEAYSSLVLFNEDTVIELQPNALETVFALERNEKRKLAELATQLA